MIRTKVFIALLLVFYCELACSFLPKTSRQFLKPRVSKLSSTVRSSGYVPPEMDPEYRKAKIPPRNINTTESISAIYSGPSEQDAKFASFPAPREGDIVKFIDDYKTPQIGKIRYLQYVESYDTFFADVIPLAPGKSNGVYTINRKAKAEYFPLSDIKPVKSYYIRAEDGYKVSFKNNNTAEVVLKAEQYRPVDKTYNTKRKPINFAQIDSDMKDYDQLKNRITTSSIKLGAAISVVLGIIFGPEYIPEYMLGVLSGCGYFYLLSKRVDAIGGRYSILQPTSPTNSTLDVVILQQQKLATNRFNENLSKLRFLVPVLCLLILIEKNIYFDNYQPKSLQLLPQKDFIIAMSGFLTLRVAIFLSEVAKEFKKEDVLGLIPGSLALTLRSVFSGAAEDGEEVLMQRKVVFITGPVAGGRYDLLEEVLKDTSRLGKNMQYNLVKLQTTAQEYAEADAKWLEYVDPMVPVNSTKVVFSGYDYDAFGRRVPVSLPTSAVQPFVYPSRKEYMQKGDIDSKKITVLIGPPSLLDSLINVKSISLSTFWISLQTKEQFINQASSIVKKQITLQPQELGDPSLAKRSAEKVSELVDDAARSINFFMAKAPLFDFTLLNPPEDKDGTLEEMRQLLSNMKL